MKSFEHWTAQGEAQDESMDPPFLPCWSEDGSDSFMGHPELFPQRSALNAGEDGFEEDDTLTYESVEGDTAAALAFRLED